VYFIDQLFNRILIPLAWLLQPSHLVLANSLILLYPQLTNISLLHTSHQTCPSIVHGIDLFVYSLPHPGLIPHSGLVHSQTSHSLAPYPGVIHSINYSLVSIYDITNLIWFQFEIPLKLRFCHCNLIIFGGLNIVCLVTCLLYRVSEIRSLFFAERVRDFVLKLRRFWRTIRLIRFRLLYCLHENGLLRLFWALRGVRHILGNDW
jgi:hypothetical protein